MDVKPRVEAVQIETIEEEGEEKAETVPIETIEEEREEKATENPILALLGRRIRGTEPDAEDDNNFNLNQGGMNE